MVSTILLAAGLSKRMEGSNKLLLPYRGKTIIENTIQRILDSGADEVIVVLGNDAEKIREKIRNSPVRILINENFESGMTSSIQKGVEAAHGKGYMICLADMVAITSEEYKFLEDEFSKSFARDPKCICQPCFGNKRGNPVIFSNHYRKEILSHSDPEGCKGIVQKNLAHVYNVDMLTNHVLLDIDSPADFENLKMSS